MNCRNATKCLCYYLFIFVIVPIARACVCVGEYVLFMFFGVVLGATSCVELILLRKREFVAFLSMLWLSVLCVLAKGHNAVTP